MVEELEQLDKSSQVSVRPGLAIHLDQFALKGLVEQLMAALAQEHEQFALLARALGNLFFGRAELFGRKPQQLFDV